MNVIGSGVQDMARMAMLRKMRLGGGLEAFGGDGLVEVFQGSAPGAHGSFDLAFEGGQVEDAVVGADGAGGTFLDPFGAGDGGDFGFYSEFFEGGFGKVEPGGLAGVGDVPEACGVGIQQIEDGFGQICRVGGRADLVVDDGEGFAGLGGGDHGAGEVGAVAAVDPGGADDEPAGWGIFLEKLFAKEFGFAIGAEGVDGVGGEIGSAGGAVEDEIGADMDEGGAIFFAEFGEIADGAAINGVGFFLLLFAEIDLGVGGAVEDEGGFV